MSTKSSPRVVLISQWPAIKNAEYELIEKIRKTRYKIAVVDYLGFDVDTGICINNAALPQEYDYAISFHFETPKFLNIPTFLWVANPLEYMHMRDDYRYCLIHHLRSYDDYLYNGSSVLKDQIKSVIGNEWTDSNLEFHASCSRRSIQPPATPAESPATVDRIFYCGVNWERCIDTKSRAQGLFDHLEAAKAVDIYGPRVFCGAKPWHGFASYKGELPFDGSSMSTAIQGYRAVLAISSEAHLKSRTSSSRVFEGFAAGVPVISDENPHVRKLFGDLVYYFQGNTEREKAESILRTVAQIRSNPQEAKERVREAQRLVSEKYCFESSLENALASLVAAREEKNAFVRGTTAVSTIDVFLFHHDPYATEDAAPRTFSNLPQVVRAAVQAIETLSARIRLFVPDEATVLEAVRSAGGAHQNLICRPLQGQAGPADGWEKMRLGEKVAKLAALSDADFTVFLTQADYPQHDYFVRPVEWYGARLHERSAALFISGFYVNDLSEKARLDASGILRNNVPVGLYRWTKNSTVEHQLGQLIFERNALRAMDLARFRRFDALYPIALLYCALTKNISLYRSRHILLRVQSGYFHMHHEAYERAKARGFWSQHYDLLSNYTHELNSLYDQFHEHPDVIVLLDQVAGHALPSSAAVPGEIDPAVYRVDKFISFLRPIYRALKKIMQILRFGKPDHAK